MKYPINTPPKLAAYDGNLINCIHAIRYDIFHKINIHNIIIRSEDI